MRDPGLGSIPLFEGCSPDDLTGLASKLDRRHLEPGERLMAQDEPGTFFAVVVDGRVSVVRHGSRGPQELAVVGAGSILGELALLRDRARSATVTAATPAEVLTGDAAAFDALLDLPDVQARVQRLVSVRLAQALRPVPARLVDGSPVLLRPLLPSDRAELAQAARELSEESLRRRFFTGGQPSQRTIDYLVDIDYVDHFAWLVVQGGDEADQADGDHGDQPSGGVATVRYIRAQGAPEEAELAFAVRDAFQGHGIGTLMLGAIGAAASVTGISRFTASLLSDNAPMKAVLAKAAASFSFQEPGVIGATLAVDAAVQLIDEELRQALQAAARDIVTAAGLALTR